MLAYSCQGALASRAALGSVALCCRFRPAEHSLRESHLESFDSVIVSPYTDLLDGLHGLADHRGGPHWPNFDAQVAPRHCRQGRPVDVVPQPWTGATPIVIERPLAWAGPTVRHFGHQVADYSMRLIPTLAEWPSAEFLFGFHESKSVLEFERAPDWLKDLLRWCGLPLSRAHAYRTAVLAQELRVVSQAEQVSGPGPSDAHLDLMDELTDRNLGYVRREGVVYVSRAATHRPVAGERYLEELLRDVGADVIRPEEVPLWSQMRSYAGADVLIFAEGSAIHGSQLLGRTLGHVVVLNRRPHFTMGQSSIEPRALSLRYAEVTAPLVVGLSDDRRVATYLGLAVFDGSLLPDELEKLGIPVRDKWDARRFTESRDADVRRWIVSESSARGTVPEFKKKVGDSLIAAGLGHLA